jgi:hypothetical protein
MFWWSLAGVLFVVPLLFYGLFRWASSDPAIDREIAKQRFRAEQDYRALRRSGRID